MPPFLNGGAIILFDKKCTRDHNYLNDMYLYLVVVWYIIQ
jgi:hypothetical protein